MYLKKTAIMAGGLSLLLAAAAQAQYRATQWLPDGEPLAGGLAWFSQEMTAQTNGDVTIEYFGMGALVPAKPTLQAIADGVAHIGFAYSGYTPSESPVTEALASFSFAKLADNTLAAAYADFVANDAEGYEDWSKHGVVPIGGWETPKYDLLCNTEPLTSLSDLEGKKVRFPGGPMSDFGKALGMIPVNIPSSEAYQAQQTGQTDCSDLRPSSLYDIPIVDVTKSVTRLRTGMTFASPTIVVNKGMWQAMTPEQRRLFLDLSARMMAKQQVAYFVQHEDALARAPGDGVELVEPDDEVTAKIDEWVAGYTPVALETARTTHGLQNPEDLFARFQTYIDKWEPIMAGVQNKLDEEELYAIFKAEIFDKIDVETYGMN